MTEKTYGGKTLEELETLKQESANGERDIYLYVTARNALPELMAEVKRLSEVEKSINTQLGNYAHSTVKNRGQLLRCVEAAEARAKKAESERDEWKKSAFEFKADLDEILNQQSGANAALGKSNSPQIVLEGFEIMSGLCPMGREFSFNPPLNVVPHLSKFPHEFFSYCNDELNIVVSTAMYGELRDAILENIEANWIEYVENENGDFLTDSANKLRNVMMERMMLINGADMATEKDSETVDHKLRIDADNGYGK